MISIEDLARELLKIEQQISVCAHHIECSKNEILDATDRAQRSFGDQQSGQYLVALLSETMKRLICADSSMYSLKSGLESCLRQLNK